MMKCTTMSIMLLFWCSNEIKWLSLPDTMSIQAECASLLHRTFLSTIWWSTWPNKQVKSATTNIAFMRGYRSHSWNFNVCRSIIDCHVNREFISSLSACILLPSFQRMETDWVGPMSFSLLQFPLVCIDCNIRYQLLMMWGSGGGSHYWAGCGWL